MEKSKLEEKIYERLNQIFAELMEEIQKYNAIKSKKKAGLLKIQRKYETKIAEIIANSWKSTTF